MLSFLSLQEPHIKSNLAARPNIKMSADPPVYGVEPTIMGQFWDAYFTSNQ